MSLIKLSSAFLGIFCVSLSYAQLEVYNDYVGGGHSQDIIISSSSSYSDPDWVDNSVPLKTINGEGLDGRKAEATRFLYQAALGGRKVDIESLSATLDFEGWIDEQMELPQTNFLSLTRQTYLAARQRNEDINGTSAEYAYNEVHFQFAWWQAALSRQDVLRQRVAFALSEIFVISTDSDIRNDGDGVASYYNMLMSNAFGNYRELIEDVTYHPAMGIYLSHFRNRVTDLENNVYPDENYAREIMQLFSIGLFELEQNGALKLNSEDLPIPTYDAEDIRNMAKVMTGLGAGAITDEGVEDGRELNFNSTANILDYTVPLVMYDEYHEEGQKIILGDKEIPEGQTGEEDIDMALDYLFNHPNVAPFIARRLIQQLVKSNPSPSYVLDVAQTFNNNGDGVRGDLAAVVKEILLHEEARDCLWKEEPTNGKLKSPVGRYIQMAREFVDRENVSKYWTSGFTFENETYQLPLSSPSVFNFYLPDHQPNGDIYDQDLYAPEFEIHNSVTSLGFANQADIWARQQQSIFSIFDLEYFVPLKQDDLKDLAKNPEVLVNEMDMRLCHGDMTAETRSTIIGALEEMNFGTEYLQNRVELAFYLTLISPDFAIQK
ncbi:DUF1800 family protein [Cryomorphaceae bacterium 1068]|nr:DUF1800 family protein [Cryomorphaceae bacterium 1068]